MFKKILLLSFIEGACVMAAELIGAKMLAPFFGSSLYVWATVLAITLFALTSGYFIGGILSEKKNANLNLYLIALLGGVFMVLMPSLCNALFIWFGTWRLIPATLISTTILLFPPVFLMGMVSPLIISLIGNQFIKPGRAAGLVYSISTLGGILSTFLCGFYIIPVMGLKFPCMAFGVLLTLIPAVNLIRLKNTNGVSIFIFALIFFFSQLANQNNKLSKVNVLYKQEGILGQLMVIEFPKLDDTSLFHGKYLMVNRIIQTKEDYRVTHHKYLDYVYEIDNIAKTAGIVKGNVLINGLGGGSLAKLFYDKGFNVKAVELDERIVNAAREYFNLPVQVKTEVDDARHYLNTHSVKNNIVVFDMFKGEENPGHVLTHQSISKLNRNLSNDGIIIVNANGYTSGKNGKGNRSIFKTIEQCGFKCFVIPVEKKVISEDFRNILIVGVKSQNKKAIEQIANQFRNQLIHFNQSQMADAVLLTDDKPILDYINAGAARLWRYYYIQNTSAYLNSMGVSFFD
jgi:spermidine synthase